MRGTLSGLLHSQSQNMLDFLRSVAHYADEAGKKARQVCKRLDGLPHLLCKHDQIKMRDYVERWVTPPRRVTSPTWGPPPPCKQALSSSTFSVLRLPDWALHNRTWYRARNYCHRSPQAKVCIFVTKVGHLYRTRPLL